MKDSTEYRALTVARAVQERGWNPVPVIVGKSPNRKNWQKLVVTDANITKLFNHPNLNCGIQMGPVSGHLSDVDLDCTEATALAKHFLPPTEAVYGRASKPKSHWLYICECPEERASKPWTDVEKKVICELRLGGMGKGAQSLAPGTIHPSKQFYEWDKDGEPAAVDYETLTAAVTKLALASLLMRHWPEKGALHSTAQVVGGFLARAGWSPEEAEHFVNAICKELSHVKEKKKHGTTAADSVRHFLQGGDTYGMPMMIETFDTDVAAVAAKYLGKASAVHDGPVIRIVKGEIARVVDESEDALLQAFDRAPIWCEPGIWSSRSSRSCRRRRGERRRACCCGR